MRRRRTPARFVLVFAVTVAAQSPVGMQPQLGLSVLKFSWHQVTHRQNWDTPRNPADNQDLANPRNDPSRDSGMPVPLGNVPVGRIADRAGERKRPRPTAENQSSAEDRASSTQKFSEYTYQVRIKNVSDKTIEAIDWEYVFVDSDAGGDFARHRFQTFRRAQPGKSLTLEGISYAPPTRILNARHNNETKPLDESVVIRCVVYSDGTADWRAGGTARDCDSLRDSARRRRN